MRLHGNSRSMVAQASSVDDKNENGIGSLWLWCPCSRNLHARSTEAMLKKKICGGMGERWDGGECAIISTHEVDGESGGIHGT